MKEGTAPQSANYKAVYTVVELSGGREHWLKIGVAFPNRDGSLTVRLNALPTTGKLIIREPRPPRSPLGIVRVHGPTRS
ncbi:MAG: hypothetical protein AAF411_02510 [Myxococcota bacterium]